MICPDPAAAQGPIKIPADQGSKRAGKLAAPHPHPQPPASALPAEGMKGLGSFGVGRGRGRSAGRSWGRSVGRERPVRRQGSWESGRCSLGGRAGTPCEVPGVELLAVWEHSHVVVAHEVAAAHGAGTLVGHEAPLDLQLRVGAQPQARHGRRLPGHPEQQQEQRRRRGPPTPGPDRHRGQRGKGVAARSWRGALSSGGASRAWACGGVCKRGKDSQPSPGSSNHPLSPAPRPQATSERGEEPRPCARTRLLRPETPGPAGSGGLARPGKRRAFFGWRVQRGPVPEGETVNSSGLGFGPKVGREKLLTTQANPLVSACR